MIVQVTGTNTWNKGAELMLVAIRDRFARAHPEIHLAVDVSFGTYRERARYGLLQKVEPGRWGRSRVATKLMPNSYRRAYGLVTDADVDAVLDASGFAFGDQHPAERTVRFAEDVERWAEAGIPVILLPQALGPFEEPVLRSAFRRVAEAATHIFARDKRSLEYARHAAGSASDILSLAPDFTNLVDAGLEGRDSLQGCACIVPNQRMIEKADSSENADAYIPLLVGAIRTLDEQGIRSILLIHGKHDAPLAAAVAESLGQSIETIRESDPVRIKGLLGSFDVVVASRFHALVSALSQGVPAIATSWSHKYEELFDDYDCADMILPVPAGESDVRRAVESTTGAGRAELLDRLRSRAADIRSQVETMWRDVDGLLGIEPTGIGNVDAARDQSGFST